MSDSGPTTPDEIRDEISETREQLADTVDAIGRKLDVKTQTQDRLREGRDRVLNAWHHRPAAFVGAGAAVVVVAAIVLGRRVRR